MNNKHSINIITNPFTDEESEASERLSKWSQVTQLLHGGVKIWTQVITSLHRVPYPTAWLAILMQLGLRSMTTHPLPWLPQNSKKLDHRHPIFSLISLIIVTSFWGETCLLCLWVLLLQWAWVYLTVKWELMGIKWGSGCKVHLTSSLIPFTP